MLLPHQCVPRADGAFVESNMRFDADVDMHSTLENTANQFMTEAHKLWTAKASLQVILLSSQSC
jgi:hypothetical protein